jgi:very-short-patch-repair endonuclease
MDELHSLAERQRGVLCRAQCVAAGLSLEQIRWRCTSKRWQRPHPGVYVCHNGPLDPSTRASAALLACGAGALLAGRSAARELGLVDEDPEIVEVQIPQNRRVVAPAGASVQRVRELGLRRHRRAAWPPCTTVEDTVLDLAEGADATGAQVWVARACQRRLTTPERIQAALERRARYRWRDVMEGAFEDVADGAESIAEIRYVHRVERAHGLPAATRQLRTVRGGRRRRDDNAYEEQKVLVEVDGQVGHVGEGRLDDHRRDRDSAVEGWLPMRVGWFDVTVESCATARDVAAVLTSRGWAGPLRPCGPACTALPNSVTVPGREWGRPVG